MNQIASGIIAAIVTPMHDDESLNLEELARQVERQISAGVSGVFCLGTNGEAYILSDDEKFRVIETVVRAADRRVPVYAGTGMPGTSATIRLSQKAKELGADALSVISPYFAAISQEEIYAHYAELAGAVDLPIVIYNMPARTGSNILPSTIARLSKVPGIVGVKDSSGNFDNMKQYIELTDPQSFHVLSGNDALILWNLLAGGAGGITAVANIYPETMVSIYSYFKSGDLTSALQAQDSIRPIRNCFQFGNPNTVIKTAARIAGNPVGPCRRPFCRLSEAAVSQIRQTIEQGCAQGMK